MSPSQPPDTMSQSPATTSLSSNIEGIFNAALKLYEKKTKKDLTKHDLFKQLENCDSPATILAVFQAEQLDSSRTGSDDRLRRWFIPTAKVLYAFSGTLGAGVGLVFSPAHVVFAGFGVLLLAAKDVAASQDILIDIFGRIESFFGRLETYTDVPLTPAMTDKMVEITVEVLGILATATKEMKQNHAKKFVKRIARKTDLEDGLKKLDTLTNEELVMAMAQLLKITHNIDNKVTGVGDSIRDVDEKVQVVTDNVKAVDDIARTITADGKEVKATATKVESIVQHMADDVGDVKWNQLRETLRRWQSPPDPSTNHNIASDRQHEGTAEWFIEDDKFEEWKATAGSGKSVLRSAIINDITALCEAGSATMAYFYFDFRDIDKKARRNLLPSLLTQLSSGSKSFCDIFSRLYKAHDSGGRQPSDSALTRCLKEMLAFPHQRPVYLIMDALDECPDTSDFPSARAQVLDLVKDLVGLRLSNLRICVTSRPEVDITDALEPLASHAVSLQDEDGQKEDIADYVRSVVHSGPGKFMRRWRQEDKEHVIEVLSEKADGMFRWVFCQLEMLQNCLPQNVQRVLRELPKSLDETYERVLKGIGTANRRQAHRLLQCLTVATRPLRVEELAEVLALDFDGAKDGIPALNKDWRWEDQKQGVLSTCSSLIIIADSDDVDDDDLDDISSCRVVQFAHFSVKEFLTSGRLADLETDISHFHISLEPAHTIVAQACLGVLLQFDNNNIDTDEVKDSFPLARYAAQYWVVHAQFESVSLRIQVGMRHLFDPAKLYLAAWRKLYDIDKEWTSFLWDVGRTTQKSPSSGKDYAPLCLYYASCCGFHDLTHHLIAKDPLHVHTRVGLNKSPLVAALRNEHIQVAELLLQHGAILHIKGGQGRTLLHAAVADGLMDVVQWLLKIGVDVNAQQDYHTTPLHLAAAKGNLELVRTLLEHSADAKAADKADHTPLHEASSGGHIDIVRLLIQHGADANRDLQGLLSRASRSESVETVQLFIQLGADVNAKDWLSFLANPPLHVASRKGHAGIMQLLIEHGADVNAVDERHSTPLHEASACTDGEAVSLLLQHGADVHAGDSNYSTPLHLSLSKRHAKTAQLLIEHGADVNARDGDYKTPLHLIFSWTDSGIYYFRTNESRKSPSFRRLIQLLIQHGADVNALDRSHKTHLHQALSQKDAEIVQLLIEHGADVNARDGSHSTPLHLASSQFDGEIVLLLIKHGADVRARDGSHSTPLHLATSKGIAETMQILIEHGADVHAEDNTYSTPFHLALSKRDAKTAQLLIEHGADVNARDRSYKTPLHQILSWNDKPRKLSSIGSVIWLLIQHGADVNARDQSHKTPLHQALFEWDAETAQLLIEHGADVHAKDESHSTLLHLALSKGDAKTLAETVQLLIQQGADVNERDGSYKTPLHLMLSRTQNKWNWSPYRRVVQLLIQHGADVNAQDQSHKTPLHLASSGWDPETVQLLIQKGADVNERGLGHKTPLHLVLSQITDQWNLSSYQRVIRLLIQQGADLNAEDQDHKTPLHLASSEWDAGTVRLLIQKGADVNVRDGSHKTPLHLVLPRIHKSWRLSSSWRVIQLLIEHGVDVHARDGSQSTPLHLASSWRNAEAVQLLIKEGADIHARDGSHSTPLHLASSRGNAETMRLLIDHGADVNARDGSSKTPLHLILSLAPMDNLRTSLSFKRVIQLLLQHGADVNARDQSHKMPLHLALFELDTDIAQLLIEHGADIHARDGNHSTPLHLASSEGSTKTVQLLIKHGADVHAEDESHSTPLHLASSKGNAETIQLLINHGLDVNACDETYATPLHLAISCEKPILYVVHLLLEHGANVSAEDDKGQTPSQIASARGHYTIAQLLLDNLSA